MSIEAWYDPTNQVVSTDKNDPRFTPLGQLWRLVPEREWVGLTDEDSDKNPLPYGSIYQPLVPFGESPPADAHPDHLYVSWDSALHRLFWWNHNTKMWDQVMEQKA